jgi:hypothetical protein
VHRVRRDVPEAVPAPAVEAPKPAPAVAAPQPTVQPLQKAAREAVVQALRTAQVVAQAVMHAGSATPPPPEPIPAPTQPVLAQAQQVVAQSVGQVQQLVGGLLGRPR